MAKKNLGVKVSGNGLRSRKVQDYLRENQQKYSITVVIGGGSDINKEFEERGWEKDFCLLGRNTDSLKKRQVARDRLEVNQAELQDILDENGINARVVIPFIDVATVLCPENGDMMILSMYLGYDKLVIFTEEKNVVTKGQWLKDMAWALRHISKKDPPGELDKIEVRGF
jgi:hypothetical protein